MSSLTKLNKTTVTTVEQQLEVRDKIFKLEAAMHTRPDVFDKECKAFPVKHYRAPGMIGREMLLPKGHLIVGKIHKHAHLNILSTGRVRVVTETGSYELIAPTTFTSDPGTKRVVYALEDTLWTTIHLNPNEHDPDKEDEMEKFENEVIAKSYDALELGTSKEEVKKIGGME